MAWVRECPKCGKQRAYNHEARMCYECAPAQEEKEMPIEDFNMLDDDFDMEQEEKAARTADLRQLHRDAALAALSGMPRVGMESNITIKALTGEAIMYADEFVRQYNPDKLIAEVVG